MTDETRLGQSVASPTFIEHLKDQATDLGLVALKATVRTSPDSWQTIEVRHAALWTSESTDGWDVTVEEHEL